MNVLLIGSGGREHAMARALRRSARLGKLFSIPGSAGMARLAEPLGGDPLDVEFLARVCSEKSIDLAAVGPEAPLAAGVCDALRERGAAVFGPSKAAARLESSKSFAKGFMERHGIPSARYGAFSELSAAQEALGSFGPRVVVKADGLASGKGVRVCSSPEEARAALDEFMREGALGEAGRSVVLEERLEGREATVMALCDGKTLLGLPPCQDHKRLIEGDQGPNTGGMGAFAPAPFLDEALASRVRSEVFDRALAGIQAEGLDFRGVLYAGLMITPEGPKVLEFNVRFGDPEAQAVLPLVESDLLDLMEATARGRLETASISLRDASCVCVVLASEGYPGRPKTGRTIMGLRNIRDDDPDLMVFHAGTSHDGKVWRTSGGRVLGVTALGARLEEARFKAYDAVRRIRFAGMQFRRDIAETLPRP